MQLRANHANHLLLLVLATGFSVILAAPSEQNQIVPPATTVQPTDNINNVPSQLVKVKEKATQEQKDLKKKLLELAQKASSVGAGDEPLLKFNKVTNQLEHVKEDPRIYSGKLMDAIKALNAKKLPTDRLKEVFDDSVELNKLKEEEGKSLSEKVDVSTKQQTTTESTPIEENAKPEQVEAVGENKQSDSESKVEDQIEWPEYDPILGDGDLTDDHSGIVGDSSSDDDDETDDEHDVDDPKDPDYVPNWDEDDEHSYEYDHDHDHDHDQEQEHEHEHEHTNEHEPEHEPEHELEHEPEHEPEPEQTGELVDSSPREENIEEESSELTEPLNSDVLEWVAKVSNILDDRLERITDLLLFRPEFLNQLLQIDDSFLTPLEGEFKRMILCNSDVEFCNADLSQFSHKYSLPDDDDDESDNSVDDYLVHVDQHQREPSPMATQAGPKPKRRRSASPPPMVSSSMPQFPPIPPIPPMPPMPKFKPVPMQNGRRPKSYKHHRESVEYSHDRHTDGATGPPKSNSYTYSSSFVDDGDRATGVTTTNSNGNIRVRHYDSEPEQQRRQTRTRKPRRQARGYAPMDSDLNSDAAAVSATAFAQVGLPPRVPTRRAAPAKSRRDMDAEDDEFMGGEMFAGDQDDSLGPVGTPEPRLRLGRKRQRD